MTVRVYDFFAGCGGASRGFQAAGMDISFALDHDADARASFQANFPDAHFEFADIRDVDVEAVKLRVEAERPNAVLFSGCAPCQPFTKQNTKRPSLDEDERVPLLAHFARLVESCRPDLVFVENVPGLQKLVIANPSASFWSDWKGPTTTNRTSDRSSWRNTEFRRAAVGWCW